MDIRVTSTGKIFYRIDPAVAALLLEALPASFEQVTEPPKPAQPKPAAPTWGIGTDGGGYPFIAYTSGGQTRRYFGSPDDAQNGFKTRVWSGEKQAHIFDGPEPPANVIEQYRQKHTGPAPSFLTQEYCLTAYKKDK